MRRRATFAAALGVAVFAVPAAPATAGTAKVDQFRGGRGDETFKYVRYDAAPGEANRVTGSVAFTTAGDVATLRDTAGVTAGPGCLRTGATTVSCRLGAGAENTAPQAFRLRLGDRDDTATIARDIRLAADIDGGAGNDSLTGGGGGGTLDEETPGPDGNFLRGGVGNDVLNGGVKDDVFLEGGAGRNGSDAMGGGAGVDRVSYSGRRRGVRADLQGDRDDGQRGERDRIASDIEQLVGGRGKDRLTGNGAANLLSGKGGEDLLRARGGSDTLRAGSGRTRDVLSGGGGADDIEGSAGNNLIDAGRGSDTVQAGRGRDRINTRDRFIDDVQCGRGRDAVAVDGLDWVNRACERVFRRASPRLTVLSDDGGPLGGEGRNYADLRFGCPRDFVARRCTGRVTIKYRGVTWGTRRVRLRRGRDENDVFVNFNRTGDRQFDALPSGRRITVQVRVTTVVPQGGRVFGRAFVVRPVTLTRD